MDRIGIRELRANAAALIRRADAGERIILTVNGRPAAQLGPIEPIDDAVTLDDLAVRGLIQLPRRPDRPNPAADVEPWAGIRLDRLMSEIRGR